MRPFSCALTLLLMAAPMIAPGDPFPSSALHGLSKADRAALVASFTQSGTRARLASVGFKDFMPGPPHRSFPSAVGFRFRANDGIAELWWFSDDEELSLAAAELHKEAVTPPLEHGRTKRSTQNGAFLVEIEMNGARAEERATEVMSRLAGDE